MAKILILVIGAPKKPFMDLSLLEVGKLTKLSSYAISKKTNEPNLKKCGPNFGLIGSTLYPQTVLQVLHLLVVRYCSKLSPCAI